MKANIILRDTKLIDTSGGATIRYSAPSIKTYGTVRELLEGFDEIEIITDKFMDSDLNLIYYFILQGYWVKYTVINNIN